MEVALTLCQLNRGADHVLYLQPPSAVLGCCNFRVNLQESGSIIQCQVTQSDAPIML